MIVESSSTAQRIAALLEGLNVVMAHPTKVRMIADSFIKTDKVDAHTLLKLYKADYLPRSYLPSKEVFFLRDLCRSRDFLVRQRTAVKNRIIYAAFQHGEDIKGFGRKEMEKIKDMPLINCLLETLSGLNKNIREYDKDIGEAAESNAYAKLVDTIPGIGKTSALIIASEIADIGRFKTENNLFSFAGLVPRIHQSGNVEWRGHIAKGNVFLKTTLIQCVLVHIRICPTSSISLAYRKIRAKSGHGTAAVAAARRLLRVIYWMLKRDETYRYTKSRPMIEDGGGDAVSYAAARRRAVA